jgi:hypothetical protein
MYCMRFAGLYYVTMRSDHVMGDVAFRLVGYPLLSIAQVSCITVRDLELYRNARAQHDSINPLPPHFCFL